MTTDPGAENAGWQPVIYRGDGAWIGVTADGRLGVGVDTEERSSLVGAGFTPMWPFMEGRRVADCLAEFSARWRQLANGGISSPERLLELTMESAWRSGRPYWMRSAAAWAGQMAGVPGFDRRVIEEVIHEMTSSEVLAEGVRAGLRVRARELGWEI